MSAQICFDERGSIPRSALIWGAMLAVALIFGCGQDPPREEGDGGSPIEDAADGTYTCEVRVDGGCVCRYGGNSDGVCADQQRTSSGACEEPESYESSEESCSDELDNDCNGDVDCADSGCAGSPCGLGQGTAKCVSGECKETVCHDDADNDQNGKVDCADPDCTDEICAQDTIRTCPSPDDWESNEDGTCDGVDNDCDGGTDEGCSCSYDPTEDDNVDTDGSHDAGLCADQMRNPQGECEKPGLFESQSGSESNCDDKDNDCDGVTDEGCECAYDPGEPNNLDTDGSHDHGICANQPRDSSGVCQEPQNFEQESGAETNCGNNDDNDCDGVVDEGCGCTYDPGEPDNADTDGTHRDGVCKGQTRDMSGVCQAPSDFERRTMTETKCDGKDNDCDGDVDEGCTCTYDPNEPRNTDTDSSHDSGVCVGQGTDSNGDCKKPVAFESTTTSEANCDGKDNDCDGKTDEGCGCTYDPNESKNMDTDGSHSAGVCPGQPVDSKGDCTKPASFESMTMTETNCDGKDNDCDGGIDEGCSCTYDPTEQDDVDTDGSHSAGVCPGQVRDSTGICKAPSSFESRTASESSCSNDDNDCDGVVDEGCPCTYDPNEMNNIDTDSSHGAGVCKGQNLDSSGVCTTPSSFESRTTSESSCSFDDNDCDGYTDEGCSCAYDPGETDKVDTDGSHSSGVCPGQTQDSTGVCAKPSNFESPEDASCDDGIDNDCDGSTDESAGSKVAGDSCQNNCQCGGGLRCIGGTCVQLVFVTSSSYKGGNLGGLSGADSECNTVATGAGLGGQWKAILSSKQTSAKSRISINAPIYNRNGDKIADGSSDLWNGNIDNAVQYDETQSSVNTDVWSGTKDDGTSGFDRCNEWTDNNYAGEYGLSYSSSSAWIKISNKSCGKTASVYCISGQ